VGFAKVLLTRDARRLGKPLPLEKKVKNFNNHLNFDINYTKISKNRRKGSGQGIEEAKKLRR